MDQGQRGSPHDVRLLLASQSMLNVRIANGKAGDTGYSFLRVQRGLPLNDFSSSITRINRPSEWWKVDGQ